MKRSRSPRCAERFNYEDDETDQASSPPSSSSSPPVIREDGFQYDVFLSFRGPDTRNGFTGHLYHALKEKGILTFIDSEELEKGQKVDKLFGYIERSKIFLPIFSKGYASSKWCLQEIAKIMECKRLVIPVFFHVKPTDVRHQTGTFGKAFRNYLEKGNINEEEVSKWRAALTEAGKLSGYHLGAGAERNEAKVVRLILKRILKEVDKSVVLANKHLVGLDSHIEELIKTLDIEGKNDVTRMVGIQGMGGLGKTTLAKAAYNRISSCFEDCEFISNVREKAKQCDGLHSLKNQLQRMRGKKVLLVFDDVDKRSQLDELTGSLDLLRQGSRIIVTTREKRVLTKAQGMNLYLYELKVLDDTQSLQLFCWHAFGKEEPEPDFVELSKEVAATAAGLPLALEIFGSHFFDLKTVKKWKAMLKKLKEDQDKDIHERLKISFDALDRNEKNVFLDIAYFFVGDYEYYALMWEGCGWSPDLTIPHLMHKSLLIIDEYNRPKMHDVTWEEK